MTGGFVRVAQLVPPSQGTAWHNARSMAVEVLNGANPQRWGVPQQPFWRTVQLIFLKVVAGAAYHRARGKASPSSSTIQQCREQSGHVVRSTIEKELLVNLQTPGFRGLPDVAVVLPILVSSGQDIAFLQDTLRSLAAQTVLPFVLVMDDGSSTPWSSEIAKVVEASQAKVHLVRMTKNTGPAGARTVGLQLLRRWAGTAPVVVCFTDSDALPDPSWCERMLEAQRQRPGIFAGCTLSCSNDPISHFHDVFGTLNGRWKSHSQTSLQYGCTVNLSIDIQRLQKLDFDPAFPRPGFEDIEFCWRAERELGAETFYLPEAIVHHRYDTTLRGLYKQFHKYGSMEPIMVQLHPDFCFTSIPVPAI